MGVISLRDSPNKKRPGGANQPARAALDKATVDWMLSPVVNTTPKKCAIYRWGPCALCGIFGTHPYSRRFNDIQNANLDDPPNQKHEESDGSKLP